jgi:NADH-quinone oxidoreductase subunit L
MPLKTAITGATDLDMYWICCRFALFIGACGKSAQIPLYTWLPDAMAGPTPVSALIHAATMVTAGIFMITRLNYLFDLALMFKILLPLLERLLLLSLPLSHWFKLILKVLAYSTVSQLGLMFLALGLGAYSRRFSCNYTCFLQGLLVLRFRICYSCFARRTRHAQNGWIKSNDNFITF